MYTDDVYKVNSILSDEVSKRIYNDRIKYLIFRNTEYIRDMVDCSCPELLPITEDIWNSVFAKVMTDNGVFLYGAGNRSVLLENDWRKYINNSVILGFLDKDEKRWGSAWLGTRIYPPTEVNNHEDASVIILTSKYEKEALELLKELGVSQDRIYTLPFVGKVSRDQYFDKEIVKLNDGEEIFLDIGCFDMETTIELKKRCKTKKVYAFEPDKFNYRICKKKVEDFGLNDVTLFEYGVSDRDGELSFAATGESYSRIATEGVFAETGHIEVRSIDSIIPESERVTFIKMDIEGMEFMALHGACNTIKRCKPKLAISLYHKPEDLTEIPLYIHELVPEYKLYIRHYSNELVETVLYAV